ncbi:MAG: acetyl-CoA carboxylase biotin carboxyl carrier protein subunit [bacterium]
MKFFARVEQTDYEIDLRFNGEQISLNLNGASRSVDLKKINDAVFSLLIDNRSYEILVARAGNGYSLTIDKTPHHVVVEDEKAHFVRGLLKGDDQKSGTLEVKAPMPGLIMSVAVAEGREVKAGEGLLIIEAMKMENEIRANANGRVKKVLVQEGESVDKDKVLMIIE